jgi:hypothetical protein
MSPHPFPFSILLTKSPQLVHLTTSGLKTVSSNGKTSPSVFENIDFLPGTDFVTEKGPGRVVLVDLEREASLIWEEAGVGVGVGERSPRQGREEREEEVC